MLGRLLARRTLAVTHPVAARTTPRTQRTVAQLKAAKTAELTFSFAPFEEVKGPFDAVEKQISEAANLARDAGFSNELEAAVNAQINVELTLSHVYSSMYAYFARDHVALRGLAKYFREEADGERTHAQRLMEFQATRGGYVKLATIPAPVSEFNHEAKGDALYAMELSLSLERLNYSKLMALDKLANDAEDFTLSDFVDDLLKDQVKDIKQAADYVSQLRRVGKGYGTWRALMRRCPARVLTRCFRAWDQELYESNGKIGASGDF